MQLVAPTHALFPRKALPQKSKPEWLETVINWSIKDFGQDDECSVLLVTHKVTAGAKSFGSFFSGVANKAGAKIKETVKANVSSHRRDKTASINFHRSQSILGEFNKEQEAFIKDQSGKSSDPGSLPWVGHQNEEKIKEEILSLSAVRKSSFDFSS